MKAANEFYWVLLLIISVLGLLGVIFLCIGTALYAREKRKRASCTQQVIASVTDIQHRAIGASGYTDADEVKMMSWFPVYEYSVHGTVLRKRASVGTVRPEVSVKRSTFTLIQTIQMNSTLLPINQLSCEKCLLVWVHYA